MISVLLLGCHGPAGESVAPGEAVRTLAALVPATVEGLVRDVAVLLCRDDPMLADVADHAGCTLVRAETFAAALRLGASQARCRFLLVTQAGVSVERGFIEELVRLMPGLGTTERPPGYLLKTAPSRFRERLFPGLAPDVAVLVPRANLLTTTAAGFRGLVRDNRPMRRFNATASRPA